MILTIEAKTNIEDLMVDFIEVLLKDGREVSLNWEESEISRTDDGITALYKGVYFGEEPADGQMKSLEGLKVLTVQTYSVLQGGEDPDGKNLILLSMNFEDGEETLSMEAPLFSGSTFELTRDDIKIDPDIEVDMEPDEDGNVEGITAYVETWFDVDRKFGVDTQSDDSAWVNLYAIWNPLEPDAKVKVSCVLSDDESERDFDYVPSDAESGLLKAMITEKIREVYHCTPEEFCNE